MARTELEMNQSGTARAVARYIRMSPYKVRALADMLRGKHVEEASRILSFTPRAAAAPLTKVLNSAVANAENNLGLASVDLWVRGVWIDEGPTLKRWRPRALGRAYKIRKRTSHITVEVGRK